MKSNLLLALDVTSLLTKLFLAAICYKVHPGMTKLMIIFYVAYASMSFYYMYLQAQEDKEFLKKLSNVIDRESQETDEEK